MSLRSEAGRRPDISIAIIGMGCMGKGLLFQSALTPGVECVAVCDLDVQKCIDALTSLHLPHQIADDLVQLQAAIDSGSIAVCKSGTLLAECSSVDVVIEASSGIATAIDHCIATLKNRKHLVLMNAEVDLTFGPWLAKLGAERGVVSTSCGGDQYGVLKELLADLQFWGFEPVMAGNIKGFLDRYANPESIVAEADKRNLDYRMCTAYTDGTKLNIEMAILANAFDMVPPRVGMLGPPLKHVTQVFEAFDFAALWNHGKPLVDYILGAEPGGGVFAIGHCDHPFQRDMLTYYKMGSGPFYLFYRPYHLCHIEALSAVIGAAREGKAFLQPSHGLKTNVYAHAKKDLVPGEVLDGVGGFTLYGLIETLEDDARAPGVPICLADELIVRAPVRKDQKVLLSEVDYDPERADFRAYKRALSA